jgi:hypothetical protein
MFDKADTPEDFDIISRAMDLGAMMAEEMGVNTDPAARANDPSTPEEVKRAYELAKRRATRYTNDQGGPLINYADDEGEYAGEPRDWSSYDQASEAAAYAKMIFNPAEGCFVGPLTDKPRVERAYYLGWVRVLRSTERYS